MLTERPVPALSAPDEAAALAAELTAALAARLAARAGDVAVEVTGLRRLPGGASRETWAFDAGGRALVLRRDARASADPATMAREAALLTAAASARVPVPALVDQGPELLGAPYLIMERLDGETIPRRLLRDGRFAPVRPRLAHELGTILARLHTISPDAVPGLPDGDPLDDLAAVYQGFAEPRPAVELALRWLDQRLDQRRPATSAERSVVHGDFRNGNLMIDPSGVRGVLDWELAHAGDPAEDLGWLCVKAWRFGAAEPVGGFGPRAALLEGYAAAGGTPPTAEALHWWEVYGTLRWTILCRSQAERYLDGSDPSIEYAVLGRKVCEQEHDLLLALGLTSPVTVPDPLDDLRPSPPSAPHDRPSAAALIDAVGAFLDRADQPDERLRFHTRVAASALRIARRELLLGDAHGDAHRARLRAFGCATDADLAIGIRDGALDDRMDEVVTAVRATVTDKLTVANPRYLALPA